jgi:hypothetical protein
MRGSRTFTPCERSVDARAAAARECRQNRVVPEHATPSFERFRAAVLDDPALERRLRAIDQWEPFTAEAVSAAGERDIELTAADIEAERRQALLGWLTRWA